jgi:hypothetical protein
MEKGEPKLQNAIEELVAEMKSKEIVATLDLDHFLDKQLIDRLSPFAVGSEKLLVHLKEILFDTNLRSPYKFWVIMYASLFLAQN